MRKPFLYRISILTLAYLFNSCNNQEKNDKLNTIRDLIIFNNNAMLASNHSGGIFISYDEGHTWMKQSNTTVKQLSIDTNGILWGIDAWIGIHEPGYSRILYSKDSGKNWVHHEFDIEKFYPVNIVSEQNSKLRIITNSAYTYELNGMDLNKDWNCIDSNQSVRKYQGYYVSESSLLIRETKTNNDTLIKLNDISICFDILPHKDSVFIAGGGTDNKAYFASYSNKGSINRIEMGGIQALGIRMDKKNRIWIFGDGGLFVKNGQKLKKIF